MKRAQKIKGPPLSYTRGALRVYVYALCVCLTLGFAAAASAQEAEEPTEAPAAETPAAPETAVTEGTAEAAETPVAEGAAEEAAVTPAAEEAVEEVAEETPAAEPPAEEVAETPTPEPSTEEVVEEVAVETPAAAEVPTKPEKPAKPEKVKEPSETGVFRLGVRGGLGISAFSGHKALIDKGYEHYAIILKPTVSASAGLAGAFAVNDFFSVAVEAQYSLYKAHGEFVDNADKVGGQDYRNLYLAGAVLHAAELPVLARFHLNPVYIEAGVAPGANVYSYVYKGSEFGKPIPNYFACGAVFGFGFEIEDVLLGVRGQYGFIEYDKNLNGYPWSVQVSITKFFLNI